MSERRLATLLALSSLLLCSGPSPGVEPSPAEVLARADRARAAWEEALLTISVTTESATQPKRTGRFQVAVKGREKALVRFVEAGDEGKLLVLRGKDAWLVLPTARNPIRVPKSHRVAGGFSVADVSRTKFDEDYDAVFERTETLDGLACDVLRLTAKKGRAVSYPVARLWIDRKEGLHRRAVFLVASGKTARDVRFEAYRPFQGILSLARLTVVDALRPGRTEVDYLSYERRKLSDALFDPATARQEAATLP